MKLWAGTLAIGEVMLLGCGQKRNPNGRMKSRKKERRHGPGVFVAMDHTFFPRGGTEAGQCRAIVLPDASAGGCGREDELLRRIMIFRQLDFALGLRELPAPVVALHPDLGQEIAASQGVEDQLCFVRRTEGR